MAQRGAKDLEESNIRKCCVPLWKRVLTQNEKVPPNTSLKVEEKPHVNIP